MNFKSITYTDIEISAFDLVKQICQKLGLVNENGDVIAVINENRSIMVREDSAFDGENYIQLYVDANDVLFCKKLLELYEIALKYSKNNKTNNSVVQRKLRCSKNN